MSSALAWFLATIITIPLLGWYLAYISHVKLFRKKPQAVRFASDFSTILFIIAVYFIMLEIWERTFLWLILVIIFSVAIIFTFIHWKHKEDIHVVQLLRGIWRFNFLLFIVVYIVLFTYGIITRIIASA
ncbi:DUF3397 domain-containing protein [Bacillus sp. FJAT-45350]|uniref:DUF3397 domain-containing protein n=1 Tax=Bacillus sp. FJAT-45350 TaxID=2011014 RepID=UPI000BB95CC7|nr:DUF3397 domain-containing protein [Bacillus sp. FJAT-45350]